VGNAHCIGFLLGIAHPTGIMSKNLRLD